MCDKYEYVLNIKYIVNSENDGVHIIHFVILIKKKIVI